MLESPSSTIDNPYGGVNPFVNPANARDGDTGTSSLSGVAHAGGETDNCRWRTQTHTDGQYVLLGAEVDYDYSWAHSTSGKFLYKFEYPLGTILGSIVTVLDSVDRSRRVERFLLSPELRRPWTDVVGLVLANTAAAGGFGTSTLTVYEIRFLYAPRGERAVIGGA